MTKNPLAVGLGMGLLVSLFTINEASACAACGDTVSKNWESGEVSTRSGLTFGLAYSYINQDQQRYNKNKASFAFRDVLQGAGNEVEEFTVTRTVTASINYASDDWGVNVQLPYLERKHGTFGFTDQLGSDRSLSNENGIGDIGVIGRYSGFSSDNSAGILAGVKLPTGATGANFNAGAEVGEPLDRSLQLGTGSTDIILGGFLAGTISHYGWFAQGTVQHAVSTKSEGGLDYRPGNTYLFNTGVSYAKFGARFTPLLQLNFINRRADSRDGATEPDALTGGKATGGTLVYLAPGASFRLGGGTSVYGFVQLPVYQDVNSIQLTPRYTLTVGVKHTID